MHHLPLSTLPCPATGQDIGRLPSHSALAINYLLTAMLPPPLILLRAHGKQTKPGFTFDTYCSIIGLRPALGSRPSTNERSVRLTRPFASGSAEPP